RVARPEEAAGVQEGEDQNLDQELRRFPRKERANFADVTEGEPAGAGRQLVQDHPEVLGSLRGKHSVAMVMEAPVSRCVLLSRPVSKATVIRLQSSLEGLNQEIERITITHTHTHTHSAQQEEIPDGRRPPPPLLQSHSSLPSPLHQSHSASRTVDTQTPNSASDITSGNRSNDSSSHAHSISPSFLSAAEEEESPPCCSEELLDERDRDRSVSSPVPQFSSSPKPNNSFLFKREPPEGCERVKVFTDQPHRQQCVSVVFEAPDRNKVNFVSNSSSAFSLLTKPSNQLRQ
ncbi:protein FAM117B-like, partial [Centroberyx gerrardi]